MPSVHQRKRDEKGIDTLICLNLKYEVVEHDNIDRLNEKTKIKFKSTREKKKKDRTKDNDRKGAVCFIQKKKSQSPLHTFTSKLKKF
jgi:hypothetical protein